MAKGHKRAGMLSTRLFYDLFDRWVIGFSLALGLLLRRRDSPDLLHHA
jgi:hypothetical protein